MTRRKKSRSIADKVQIRTGRRKDFKKWRAENPDQVHSGPRYVAKKKDQRKSQAAAKLERMNAAPLLPLHPDAPTKEDSSSKDDGGGEA
ncbi:hypothetical protein F8A90_04555 [Cobetia sp. cqz5-12]|uniref:hypothetical protein n=1 Tax=Cobetia sp. cqz5-12 TaxID=2609415 RepID=UPI0019061970|nr:hypothetical protein [Cobetia sp. cqz5-12]QQK63473.1 hypothetical protein F8A90_04555 [Cobetia sp. cqz5-12]